MIVSEVIKVLDKKVLAGVATGRAMMVPQKWEKVSKVVEETVVGSSSRDNELLSKAVSAPAAKKGGMKAVSLGVEKMVVAAEAKRAAMTASKKASEDMAESSEDSDEDKDSDTEDSEPAPKPKPKLKSSSMVCIVVSNPEESEEKEKKSGSNSDNENEKDENDELEDEVDAQVMKQKCQANMNNDEVHL